MDEIVKIIDFFSLLLIGTFLENILTFQCPISSSSEDTAPGNSTRQAVASRQRGRYGSEKYLTSLRTSRRVLRVGWQECSRTNFFEE